MHELEIDLRIPEDMVNRLYRALSVESNREIPRTKVEIRGGESLRMKIMADDVHALRAAMNSYMRWLQLSLKIEEVIEDGS